MNFYKIYKEVYKNNNLLGVERLSKRNPLLSSKGRKSSVAIAGGALGDEGKGRVTDELTSLFLQDHSRVIHSQALALDLFMITVGPKREQSLFWF